MLYLKNTWIKLLTISLLRPFSKKTKDKALAASIRNIFGFKPGNIFLYKLAFRHKSAAVDLNNSVKVSNERLEYLGDAILSAIVADFLFKLFPLKDEGFLTEMRSKMVSRVQLNKLAQKLGLERFIESQQENFGTNRSMMGDAFEAFIGALYIDKGYKFTQKVLLNNIIAHHYNIEEIQTTEVNYKSRLLEWAQREKKTLEFVVITETGNCHNKQYLVEVVIDGQPICRATNFSIKSAEQLAAEKAYDISANKPLPTESQA